MRIYGNYFGYNTVTPPVVPTDENGNPVKDDSVFCDPALGKKPWELTFGELSLTRQSIVMYRVVSKVDNLNVEKPGVWWSVDTGKDQIEFDRDNLFTVTLTPTELDNLVPQAVDRRLINETCFEDHPIGTRLVTNREEFDCIQKFHKSFFYFRRGEEDGRIEIAPSIDFNEKNWLYYIARLIDDGAPLPEEVIKDFKERVQGSEQYKRRFAEYL